MSPLCLYRPTDTQCSGKCVFASTHNFTVSQAHLLCEAVISFPAYTFITFSSRWSNNAREQVSTATGSEESNGFRSSKVCTGFNSTLPLWVQRFLIFSSVLYIWINAAIVRGAAVQLNLWPVRDSPEKKVSPLPPEPLWHRIKQQSSPASWRPRVSVCVHPASRVPSPPCPEHRCNQLLSSLKPAAMKCLSVCSYRSLHMRDTCKGSCLRAPQCGTVEVYFLLFFTFYWLVFHPILSRHNFHSCCISLRWLFTRPVPDWLWPLLFYFTDTLLTTACTFKLTCYSLCVCSSWKVNRSVVNFTSRLQFVCDRDFNLIWTDMLFSTCIWKTLKSGPHTYMFACLLCSLLSWRQ